MSHTYRCPACSGTMRRSSVSYTCDAHGCDRTETYSAVDRGRYYPDMSVDVPVTGHEDDVA